MGLPIKNIILREEKGIIVKRQGRNPPPVLHLPVKEYYIRPTPTLFVIVLPDLIVLRPSLFVIGLWTYGSSLLMRIRSQEGGF